MHPARLGGPPQDQSGSDTLWTVEDRKSRVDTPRTSVYVPQPMPPAASTLVSPPLSGVPHLSLHPEHARYLQPPMLDGQLHACVLIGGECWASVGNGSLQICASEG